MHKMTGGCYGDIWTWIQDEDVQERLFRVWTDLRDPDEVCLFVYFTQFIQLPNNDILIGMQAYDESYDDNRYPMIDYRLLSQIQFAYVPNDEDDEKD